MARAPMILVGYPPLGSWFPPWCWLDFHQVSYASHQIFASVARIHILGSTSWHAPRSPGIVISCQVASSILGLGSLAPGMESSAGRRGQEASTPDPSPSVVQ